MKKETSKVINFNRKKKKEWNEWMNEWMKQINKHEQTKN